MHIEIRANGIKLSEALRNYINHRIQFSLRRFRSRLGRAVVRLKDINGPRGGADKRYRVSIRLRPYGKVLVEQVHSDLYSAIRSASARLGHLLSSELNRRKKLRRLIESVRKPVKIRRRRR
jgi:ribosomal subunit interface protein